MIVAPVLEAAYLQVREGEVVAFEQAFTEASSLIATTAGYAGHTLQRCLEVPGRYLLLVQWQTLEAHTVGFRQSTQYQQWRALLHHFYDPFPVVEHFTTVLNHPCKDHTA
ncbi:antibiotic biosynthesis monooxygenase [Vogesella sp. DC21W]|uniref:Antibiotic biosynthesis monooxygenase n=1 Tax=Vogesella aquatica TaxID=2984206 RepID=A0ABT5IZ26_9NEIS|nr:antibiotic biosynthesis monooxygenase [Vogesella aquatica]MDC7717802.1 antibiotic biosynthesis monooxygenase [Vogesella aquatica]